MRAAVTGGAGFIGSHVVDALVARGDDVLVIDDLSTFGNADYVNPRSTLDQRDIRDGIELQGAEVVFHLAAQTDVQTSMRDPSRDAHVNVVGTVKVLEAAQAGGARVVFTSTGGAIYGECPEPATEDTPRRPGSPYGIAKLCGEEYLFGFNRIHDSTHVVCRLGNVFGPRQAPTLEGGVVSIFLDRFTRGDRTVIYGDGDQVRDFVYVGDVVEALLAASTAEGGVFNVGSGLETTVSTLHAVCAQAAGTDQQPELAPARLGDLRRSSLDVSRAAGELGFRACTSLESGIARTWEWTKERAA